MKAILKPVLLTAVILCTAVCVVVAVAMYWIQSEGGLTWLQAQIDRRIPGRIAIEGVRLSPLAQRLVLLDVVLYGDKEAPLAGFSRLSVQLNGWALLHREVRLASVALVEPWAHLVVDHGGSLNLATALAPPAGEAKPATADPTTGPSFHLVLENGELTGGRFTYDDEKNKARLETADVALVAAGNLSERSCDLTLTMAHAKFENEAVDLDPARIEFAARMEEAALTKSVLDVTSKQLSLHLSGTARDLTTTPLLDGRITVETNLSHVKDILGLDGAYDGVMEAALTFAGRADNPEAGFRLRFDGGAIAGQPVDNSRVSVTLDDRRIAIQEAEVSLARGKANLDGDIDLSRAFPSGFLTPPENVDAIAYDLELTASVPDLGPWLKRFVDIGGTSSGRIHMAGTGVKPADMVTRLTATSSGENLVAPGMDRPVDAKIELSAQVNRGEVALSRIDLSADGIHLSGDGRFHTQDRTVSGDLDLHATDLRRIMTVVGRPGIQGNCIANLTVGGRLHQPQFALDLTAGGLATDDHVLGDLAIHARMDPEGVIDFSKLTLTNRKSRVRGNARLRWQSAAGGIDERFDNRLGLTLESVSASDFIADAPISGTVDGQLRLSGPLSSITGDGTLSATALATDAVTIGDLSTHMVLTDGTLRMDRFRLTNRDSAVTASGHVRLLHPETVRWMANPSFDIEFQSDHINPSHFVDSVDGDLTLDGELQGTLDDPTGRLRLSGNGIDLYGQPLQALSMDLHVARQRLNLDRLVLAVAPDQQLAATGWMDWEKQLDMRIHADGIAIANIPRLKDLWPGQGRLKVDATARGLVENPDIEGGLTITDLVIQDQPMQDFHLTARLHDKKVRLDGDLDFSVKAHCDLKNGDFDANLAFDGTETKHYFKAMGKPELDGTLTGRVTANGNLRDLPNLSADVQMEDLRLLYNKAPLISSDRVSVRLANRKLAIADFDLTLLDSGNLRLTGEAQWDGPVDVTIDTKIPLVAAGRLTDELGDATGTLNLAGAISGRMKQPQIDATLHLDKIGLTVPGLNQKLHDLNGQIHLTDKRLDIDALSGLLDTGRFSINGGIAHERFTPVDVDLTVSAKALPLEVPETLSVLLNGNIQLTGRDRSAEAKGDILFIEGTYYKDMKTSLLQIASSAAKRQRAVAPSAKPVSIPYFETVRLNITIGHRQPFVVDNNLAELEISPDLTIGGTIANPVVNGRAQVREGTVTFQKKTFEVKKGVIDFIDPYRTQADIDIQSEAKIRDWTITLSIKGTPDNLDFSLSSVPSESDSDILSLILFGRTARELAQGEGGTKQTTAQIMAEMIADTFGDDIKRKTGVDILEVETNGDGNEEDASGVKVTVGKHLSDRMTVKYAVETKDGEVTQRAISEYKLLEHILVSGFQDSKGIYGSELVYRIEFR